MILETPQTTKYIDSSYYTNQYKPELNARIAGNYNKVNEHLANFDAYALRASDIVNRLTHNEIENLGGFDALPNKVASYIARATASLVEYWFINDYKLGDINFSFSMAGMSLSRIKQNETLRKFIPETTLTLVQLSGLAKNSVAFMDSTSACGNTNSHYSLLKEFYNKDETDALFQRKGNYDNNFHTSIDISAERTGTTNPRYYNIAKQANTDLSNISFSLIGNNGSTSATATKYFVSIVRNAQGLVDAQLSGVSVINPNADHQITDLLEFLVVPTQDNLEIYIKGNDIDIANPLITDIPADNVAIFGNFGSTETDPNGTILTRLAYASSTVDVNGISDRVDQIENDVNIINQEIANADFATMKTNIATNTSDITDIKGVNATQTQNIATNTQDITNLKGRVQVVETTLPKKLDTQYTTADNGKLPQVVDGKLQLVAPTQLTASNVIGIQQDDNSLTTTEKRYSTAINGLVRDKVSYRNQGQTFKVDGDDATTYDLRQIATNNAMIKAVQETFDNVAKTTNTIDIHITTPIPFVVSGTNLVADVSTLTALASIASGNSIIVKVVDTTTNVEVEIKDFFNNGRTQANDFYGSQNVQLSTTPTNFTITGVAVADRTNKTIIGIYYVEQGVSVDVSSKANIDLGNIADATFKSKGIQAGLATQTSVDTKLDTTTYTTDKAAQATKDTAQDTAIAAKLDTATYTTDKTAQTTKDTAQDTEIAKKLEVKGIVALANKKALLTFDANGNGTLTEYVAPQTQDITITETTTKLFTSHSVGDIDIVLQGWTPKKFISSQGADFYSVYKANVIPILTNDTLAKMIDFESNVQATATLHLDTNKISFSGTGTLTNMGISVVVEYERTKTFKAVL